MRLNRQFKAKAVFFGGAFFVSVISWSLVGIYSGTDIAYAPAEVVPNKPAKPRHISTPEPVKAIYMTSWVAGTQKWRKDLAELIKKTELNSLVIDVKDYSGMVAFNTGDNLIAEVGSEEIRMPDLKYFIEELHDAGIYTIARITVFQDPHYSKKYPESAVKTKSGLLWRDKNKLTYVDPAAKEFWDYIARVARAAEQIGFDELNFDYIRFPSDGNMSDISFPISGKRNKVEVLTDFFAYLDNALSDIEVPISADVFGMVTTNYDDLNIGQVLEAIEPHFDYIAPMVYPSHYPPTFLGLKNPAAHPYEVVFYSMSKAVERLNAVASSTEEWRKPPPKPPSFVRRGEERVVDSSSGESGLPNATSFRAAKLRPWIQDFGLGAIYDAAKVRGQIEAVYDAGLTSWMVWDASNKYTRDAYIIAPNPI